MDLVVAPSRVFKTVSMWIMMLTGVGDLAVVLVQTLAELHYITPTVLAGINAVLLFIAGAARLVQQNIAYTADQKVDAIKVIQTAPVKPESS